MKPDIAYSDVVIIIMHDLHSNSGAIKLNQTGGMLKHLRTRALKCKPSAGDMIIKKPEE